MNLLKEGLIDGTVIKTDRATKLMVDGLIETYPIYQVRLDRLYFNDQNDRIATWISQYMTDNNITYFDKTDIEAYNTLIQTFIYNSNPTKIKATQKNIEFIGQQKHGVVLNDGRIIDGNRRFTCLRNLATKNPKFNFFETVILERDYENSAKLIKMLELQIQLGEESRVDYNPIDKLAGIYRDIVENNLLTVEEYAKCTNQSEFEVRKQLELSKLLVEFLDSIKAPGQFYIARDLDLNGPLIELSSILKKVKDEDKRQEVKYIVFTNFLIQPDKDMTRFIRNLKGVVNSQFLDEFIEKEIDLVEEVLDDLPDQGHITTDVIAKVKANEEVKEQLVRTMDLVSNKVKATETKNRPNQMLLKAMDLVEAIDGHIVKKLTDEQKEDLRINIAQIEETLSELKEVLER